MPQFVSKAEEKIIMNAKLALAEFLTWYHQQELPEYEKPL